MIVGGGNVAERKAQTLIDAGFHVFVVAEHIGDTLRALLARHESDFAERPYELADLGLAALVIAATNDAHVNARVVDDARAARVLVCDASEPERGDFTMPATARVGTLTIGVESGSPAFSRRIARELAAGAAKEYAVAARTLAEIRALVKQHFSPEERAEILRALAERPTAELASMRPATVICASRRSPLAMVQSRSVAVRLAERGIVTRIVGVTTSGDRDQQTPIERLESVNVFVSELEAALRERHADYAVHSCKDLPSALAADMRLAAISAREDPRDVFCSERFASFDDLPSGSAVGTSSPRRRTQLAALRPDLRYEPLRGNVDTRLRKLHDGEYDAVVLAMAGVNRLQCRAAHMVPFPIDRVVPAVGQGALAVEVRAGEESEHIAAAVREALNDATAELCVVAERAALRALRAGCSAPIGIHAHLDEGLMTLVGAYAVGDGTVYRERLERRIVTSGDAEALGAALAARFVATGVPQ